MMACHLTNIAASAPTAQSNNSFKQLFDILFYTTDDLSRVSSGQAWRQAPPCRGGRARRVGDPDDCDGLDGMGLCVHCDVCALQCVFPSLRPTFVDAHAHGEYGRKGERCVHPGRSGR
jgi:hypothetical protein